MDKNIISHKVITQLISEKKRIRLNNYFIQTSDVNHIIAKDIVELYLKFNFCSQISWVDTNGNTLKTDNFFTNLYHILVGIISIVSITNRIKKLLKIETADEYVNMKHPTTPLKILYLRTDHWFNLKSGGSVGHTSGVINSLVKKNVLNSLISSSSLFQVDWKNNYTVKSPYYSKICNAPNLPELNYNLDLIKAEKSQKSKIEYNIIYQRYSLGNFFGLYLRNKYKIPLVLEFNGSEVWVSKNWNNKKIYFLDLISKIELANLNHADKIIVVSSVLKNTLIEKGIDGSKILVNPNGVDTSIYHPNCGGNEIKKQLNISNQKVIGFIGTFGKWHGALVMAQAIKLFFDTHPALSTTFLLIGEGNDLPEVKQIIKNAGYESKVIYTGRIDQSEGPKYLDACDILLSPHIPNSDGSDFFGSPTKLFEYMAMGKAIIASNLNQIGDILEHNKTAILVEPNHPQAIVNAIIELHNDHEKQLFLGQNARKVANENYSWDKHVENILNFIYA